MRKCWLQITKELWCVERQTSKKCLLDKISGGLSAKKSSGCTVVLTHASVVILWLCHCCFVCSDFTVRIYALRSIISRAECGSSDIQNIQSILKVREVILGNIVTPMKLKRKEWWESKILHMATDSFIWSSCAAGQTSLTISLCNIFLMWKKEQAMRVRWQEQSKLSWSATLAMDTRRLTLHALWGMHRYGMFAVMFFFILTDMWQFSNHVALQIM